MCNYDDLRSTLVKRGTFAARKKAVAAALVKQRSVAHRVHLRADGCSSAPAGTRTDVRRGSSSAATWFDTVISACNTAMRGMENSFGYGTPIHKIIPQALLPGGAALEQWLLQHI